MVSLLKAYYGDAATTANQFAYDLLPKISGDYSFQSMLLMMNDSVIRGLICMGQNPAVGGQTAVLARRALGNLDWLVVRDLFEIETAAFWHDAPEVRNGEISPEEIKTEIFLLPASVTAEKAGSYTNTQRLVQWHDQAVDAPGDCRSEGWFIDQLYLRLMRLYEGESSTAARQLQSITWDYPHLGARQEPDLEAVLAEVNGYRVADGAPVSGFGELTDDGSTACGCWIYSGIMPEPGQNLAKRRDGDAQASLNWGFAWPANRRNLYNRASARPDGSPWSERKRWVWWDKTLQRWTGFDVPDFPLTKPPDYEPWETPVTNALYPEQPRNPAAMLMERDDNRYHALADPRFPHVITTYRLTEHHTAGGMSRTVPWLAELQPEGFVEIDPMLARTVEVVNGDWVTVSTLRGEIEAKALVTDRMAPLQIQGRTVHQIGVPWHFGYQGIAKGGIANDLSALVEDPNSLIHEGKAFTCALRKGRIDD
jgi:formate dehydrogenase major subunit